MEIVISSYDNKDSFLDLTALSATFYLTRPRGPCQVNECKIILEQSLLTGWLELSTLLKLSGQPLAIRILNLVGIIRPGWLAIGIVNLVSNIIKPSWVEFWNKVETSCHEWSDAHEGEYQMHQRNRSDFVDQRMYLNLY